MYNIKWNQFPTCHNSKLWSIFSLLHNLVIGCVGEYFRTTRSLTPFSLAHTSFDTTWARGSCWGRGTEFQLAAKAWVHKKIPPTRFPNCMLENAWVKFALPYALLPCHEGAKWDTIGVIKGINVRLPHHKGITVAYPMENKMPLVLHVIEWQGCGYTIENNKSLNERIWRHSKMKPKSKLMQAKWEQGKVLSWDGHGGLD
jgi:hypothetical protein